MNAVERATRAELRRLGVSVQSSALAAGAVKLARLLDDPAVAASAAAAAMRELRMTLGEVASLSAPTRPGIAGAEAASRSEDDELEQVRRNRERRRSG